MEMSGMMVLLVTIVASRIIGERGYARLSSEDKLRLMDGFSGARAYSMIPLVLLVAAYWFLSNKTEIDPTILAIGYFVLLIVYVIVRAVLNQSKLQQLQLPPDYRRTFITVQAVSLLGVAWFFYTLAHTGQF